MPTVFLSVKKKALHVEKFLSKQIGCTVANMCGALLYSQVKTLTPAFTNYYAMHTKQCLELTLTADSYAHLDFFSRFLFVCLFKQSNDIFSSFFRLILQLNFLFDFKLTILFYFWLLFWICSDCPFCVSLLILAFFHFVLSCCERLWSFNIDKKYIIIMLFIICIVPYL